MPSKATVLHRTRWHLAALTLQVRLARLMLTLNAFNPLQPRVPAGSPEGGEWTNETVDGEPHQGDDARIILVGGLEDRRYSVVLEEEEARGGHTLRTHVGKTDEEMLQRIRKSYWETLLAHGGIKRNGSFSSREAANDVVNRTLREYPASVDQVASGKLEEDFLRFRFDYKTGREAYSIDGTTYMRDTYGVGVYIIHDPRSPRGYRVHTA